ncbi:class I SAM-dependent methyltransferase [Halomonas sp. I5-271120]|uniref:class I SAM-dependent methyltransferase n=1 Tax=Halomonas sp. I5-271120 TaxID=3061632 RepID=UPI00271491DF|nr:methyltransferase [Halomonas sp. I5-271120]
MSEVIRTHFFDYAEDKRLDERNVHFWRALVGHVQADGCVLPGATVLDIGCHRGGLLELVHERLRPSKLIGLEPLISARRAAAQRLARFATEIQLVGSDGWSELPDASVDLILGHEILQYISDPSWLMAEIRRVLAPGRFAYLVLGCHTENPLWVNWKHELEELGHVVYDHSPLELMAAGSHAGLKPSVRPLRDTGWVFHDPSVSGSFSYPSVGALLKHQFRHKLLFRFENRE